MHSFGHFAVSLCFGPHQHLFLLLLRAPAVLVILIRLLLGSGLIGGFNWKQLPASAGTMMEVVRRNQNNDVRTKCRGSAW